MKKKTPKKLPQRKKASRPRDPSPYPPGWNRKRVQAVIDYYENQSDEEAIAEAEAAYKAKGFAMIQVPLDLVPKVQKLISKRAS